jgi:hypothetical protein
MTVTPVLPPDTRRLVGDQGGTSRSGITTSWSEGGRSGSLIFDFQNKELVRKRDLYKDMILNLTNTLRNVIGL